jgi:hypothetical protein
MREERRNLLQRAQVEKAALEPFRSTLPIPLQALPGKPNVYFCLLTCSGY